MVVARAQGMAGLVGVLATYISTLSSMPATLLNPAMQSSCFNMSQKIISVFTIVKINFSGYGLLLEELF